jgi:CRP/FNR family cyclic AMP-dependent transcriptional regulator
MFQQSLNQLSLEKQASVLGRVPLLRELQLLDQGQYNNILKACSFVELSAGELVFERGAQDQSLCFLLAGELSVFSHEADGVPLNNIIAGEMFGDLAILDGAERKVTVAVAHGAAKASYLKINFELFGTVNDFSLIGLAAKIKFYRAIVYAIRWRIELKKSENRLHPLMPLIKKVAVFTGEKDSVAELQSLYLQARQLACLLTSWDGNSYCDEATLQDIRNG